jgi:hypothetical protein
MTSGAADQALEWQTLSACDRSAIKSQYAAAGIKLLVSVFGATDAPTTAGCDPTALANTMAAWVKKYDLDGIDVDYEDFDAFDGSSGSAVTWLKTFTKQLRVHLPQGSYILTHARVLFLFFSKSLSEVTTYHQLLHRGSSLMRGRVVVTLPSTRLLGASLIGCVVVCLI